MESAELRFTSLYHDHRDAIYYYALRRTDRATAEDVVSETLTVAWRRLASVPEDSAAVKPWLLGVARGVLANAARSDRRASALSARIQAHEERTAAPDFADAVAERQRVLSALRQLSDRDREALCLVGWDDLSIAEAAIVLGTTRQALTVRLHRARRRLRRALMTTTGPAAAKSASPAGAATTMGA
jgi:RNA polymerase sigma factor (sigma-70 family)